MISVIVPAYNEAGSIARVVRFAKDLEGVGEVLVVDDGSSDDSARLAQEAGARVIVHERNKGKTAAVLTAARTAAHDDILMLDADMQGLHAHDFEQAIKLYADADMVVLDYGRQHWIVRYVLCLLPATSGARILPRAVLLDAPFSGRNVWEIEGVINRYMFSRGMAVRVHVAEDLFSPRKESKYGRLAGAWLNLRSLVLISLSLGVLRLPRTWLDWWRFQRLRQQSQ